MKSLRLANKKQERRKQKAESRKPFEIRKEKGESIDAFSLPFILILLSLCFIYVTFYCSNYLLLFLCLKLIGKSVRSNQNGESHTSVGR